jgi:cold shock protein
MRHFALVAEGTVNYWNDDEGWGVLTSPEVPGEVWAHFSHITDGDETGYRSLNEGDRVQFEWEDYPPGQDGYFLRARRVTRLDGPEGGSGVREPRRPKPAGGCDVIELPPSKPDDAGA